MPINAFALCGDERPIRSKTFTVPPCPNYPQGASFMLTLQKPGQIENAQSYDRGQQLIARYIGDPDDPDAEPPVAFPPMLDGSSIEVSPTVLQSAAAMEVLQPASAAERYSAEDFVAMQKGLPKAVWREVSAFVRDVRKGAQEVPLDFGADTAASSAPA